MPEIGYISNFNGKDFVYRGAGKGWEKLTPEPRYALVRVELIGEPTLTPEGKTLQLARLPWQRPDDASVGIGLDDIVALNSI